MNPEDMVKFIESLSDEQRVQFEHVFKTIGEVSNAEVKETTEEVVSSKSEVKEDFRVTNAKSELDRGRVPVRAKKNSWQDTGEWQLQEGEEEWSNARKKSSRNRPKANKTEIECSVCGRTYLENPSLIYGDYHRCNRCGGK